MPDPIVQEHFSILLYLFSSFIQADAAIFAIFGVFVVFRLQGMESDYNRDYNNLTDATRQVFPDVARDLALARSRTQIKQILLTLNNPSFDGVVSRILTVIEAREVIKRSLTIPLVLFSIHIALNSVCLVFSNLISKAGVTLFYVVAGLSIALFLVLIYFLIRVVRITLIPAKQVAGSVH